MYLKRFLGHSKGDEFRNCIKLFIFQTLKQPLWAHHSYIGLVKYYFYIYLEHYTNLNLPEVHFHAALLLHLHLLPSL